MGRNIQVAPEQLDSTAVRIENLAEEYKTQYDKFYTETSAMSSTFSGKAYDAFITQIDGFKDDFDEMYRLMLAYADFLKKAAKAYRDTQDAAVAQAKKLTN